MFLLLKKIVNNTYHILHVHYDDIAKQCRKNSIVILAITLVDFSLEHVMIDNIDVDVCISLKNRKNLFIEQEKRSNIQWDTTRKPS